MDIAARLRPASTSSTTTSREQTWRNTRWLGTDVLKCPLDLWVYQELLHELRPDLIIETGTCLRRQCSLPRVAL